MLHLLRGPSRTIRTASSYSSTFTPISSSLAVMDSKCFGITLRTVTSPPVAAAATISVSYTHLVIGGLAARGVTQVEEIEHIERGYENIVEKFQALGADIQRVSVADKVSAKAAL